MIFKIAGLASVRDKLRRHLANGGKLHPGVTDVGNFFYGFREVRFVLRKIPHRVKLSSDFHKYLLSSLSVRHRK
jgi:hypothetical protein